MAGLKFSHAYQVYMLLTTKVNFDEHLDHLKQVLTKLSNGGLMSIHQITIFKLKNDCLGYRVALEGIQSAVRR